MDSVNSARESGVPPDPTSMWEAELDEKLAAAKARSKQRREKADFKEKMDAARARRPSPTTHPETLALSLGGFPPQLRSLADRGRPGGRRGRSRASEQSRARESSSIDDCIS
jgi:hypothetical protein